MLSTRSGSLILKNCIQVGKEEEKNSRIAEGQFLCRGWQRNTPQSEGSTEMVFYFYSTCYFSLCLVSYWCHKCWLGCCHSPTSSPGWLLRSWQILHNYSVWGPVRTSTKNKIWSLQKIWKFCYLPFPWSPLRLAKFFANQKRQLK